MKVVLTIPYWGDDPLREKNFEWVYQHVLGLHSWWSVGTGTFGCPNPTRGGVRNHAVRWAETMGADVVVLCDSDLIPTAWGLGSAIGDAFYRGGLQFAYNEYKALNQYGTALLFAGEPTMAYHHLETEAQGGLGGVMAIRPDQWWMAGGSPELQGWGFEDVIFSVQTRTLLETDNAWHPGRLTHLYHPTECRVGSFQYIENITICKQYEAANGDKEAIKQLIRSRY